jgi:hypothetical protein
LMIVGRNGHYPAGYRKPWLLWMSCHPLVAMKKILSSCSGSVIGV